jgi:hypothetical protein
MWWSRKKKQDGPASTNRVSNRISAGVNNYVTVKQAKLAGFLNRKTQGLSTGGKKLILVAICLVFGGMSLYLIINTVWSTSKPVVSLKPKAISVPEHMDKTGEESLRPRVLVSEQDMNEVRMFKVYMDSLKKSVKGKPLYDSILKARPGLMDTVGMLEELYLLQKK